jgi:hypothetical protein
MAIVYILVIRSDGHAADDLDAADLDAAANDLARVR